MENIKFSIVRDPIVLAKLNKPVQDQHFHMYPEFFKTYSEDDCIAFFKRQLNRGNWVASVVQIDNENAGYISYFIKEYKENVFRKSYKSIYIDQISILKKFKGNGIGKKMMFKIEEDAKKLGIFEIELSFWELNEEAKGFYEYLGYHTRSRIVGKTLS
ncbi:GNAT family N-acetyltransferase [Flagellimonas sp. CMM7]|uniref:GNAT family N-acetyltransferase n=1 Tax=Flagellimonas sp. CMM7 TaxID=2654676 RepID=UPI0013D692D9|nr:GNAT family N-acetyltransferase [Flagellimonas sp. CMM7]UII79916.1 GNAT family N-acetyltransferase [Flagellimonas sp. CMM7]